MSLGFDCLYEPSESAANVIIRKGYESDLEQRVLSVEHKLQRLDDVFKGHLLPCPNNYPCRLTSSTPAPEAVTRARETHATGLEEPQDEDASTNGMAMTFVEEHSSAFFGESSNINFTQLLLRAIAAVHQASPAITSAVDKDSALQETIIASVSQAQPHRPVAASSTHLDSPPTTLPSVEEMDSLLDIYFDTFGAIFPFIHEETMRKTYTECRLNCFTRARRTWLGTLNMMFAMASSLDRDYVASAKKRFERSNIFYKRALELCGDLSRRVISLEMVHYLLLLVIHCQGTQRSVQAWNNHGLVIRSAIALGLHSHSTRKPVDPVSDEYRRRTWAVIYCLDKVLSVAFGRPASVPDEQMTGREPVPGLSTSALIGPHGNVDLPGEFLAVSFKLYQVMARSLTNQYGANLENADLCPDDIASLKASGELRQMLQGWAASLPSYLHLCEPASSVLSQNSPGNRFRVILTLRYHNLAILIHKPLLSATIRHLFRAGSAPGGSPPYLTQLAMAEAHECVRAAQLTIEIVHCIITADSTSKNNLGAWFFTLYYGNFLQNKASFCNADWIHPTVFTASLVICGRLLWAQHGENVVGEAAVKDSKILLGKAETIFHKLDHENSLVLSCLEYIRRLGRMCSIKG
ncbi:C6 transcription factor [Aspergillus luchuensis]|uniref:C6 transcription factor n=1 Tax=Aspergillus kawachii TaxID=1069201 RepID=A0A146FWS1_ASPKA|nr:C6 transcription factor [Aspergillus luchuensis]